MDIGSLTGEITLEDHASSVLDNVTDKIKDWAIESESSLAKVALGFGVVTAAVLGTAASITALGEKGSTLLGVETAFDHLAIAAGTTGDELRGSLSEGLKGTVDEMETMQSVQRLLVSGFKLTNDQALMLAQTARELGKAFGVDAASELETLSTALTTGRTRTLALQGVVVDVKKGEEEFAKSIGTTVDQLNAEGLLEGKRIAIMEGIKAKRDALGESELNFKERLLQTKAELEDWGDSLAKSVASSPQVLQAYDDIKNAVIKAFGGDSQDLLDTTTGLIDKFASLVSEYGPSIIQTFVDIWTEIRHIAEEIEKAWDLVPDWMKNIARDATLAAGAIWLMQAAFFAIVGTGVVGTLANVGSIVAGLPSLFLAANAALTEFMVTAGTLGTVAFGLSSIVIALASVTTALYAGSIAWDIWRTHSQNATDAARLAVERQKTMTGAAALAGHDFDTLGAAETYLRDRVKEVNGLLTDQERLLHQPGAVAGDVTKGAIPVAAQSPDRAKFIKDQSDKIEAATSASIAKTQELWDQYFTTLDKMNLDSVGAQVLAIDRKETAEVAALDKSKKYNQDYQNQLQAIEAVAAVNRAAIYEDLRRKNVAADEKALTESQAALVADGEKRLSLSTATFDKLTSAAEKEQRALEDVTTTGLDRQLLDIQRSAEDQIAALGAVPQDEALASLWQANVDKIHAIQQQQVDNLYIDNAAMVKDSTDTLQAIADKNYTTWMKMAADPDTYSKQAIQDMKDIADASQRTALGIQKSLGADLFTALKGVPNTIADAFKSGGSLLSAAESLGSQFGAIFGKHIGTSISDAVSGLGSLAGPIGAAVGSLVGPIISLFSKIGGPSKDQLAARSTFADFQKQFGTLPQTIDAVGAAYARMGLTGTEAQRDIQRALDATHVSAAAEASALDTINLVMKEAAQQVQNTTDALKAEAGAFNDVVAGTKEAVAVYDDVHQAVTDAADAMMKFAVQSGAATDKVKTTSDAIQYLIDTGQTGSAEFLRLDANLITTLATQSQVAQAAKQELADLGTQAVASFSIAIANGQTFAQALASIAPSLDTINQSYADLGITTDDETLKVLLMQETIMKAAPELVKAVSGLAGEMDALNTLGILNVDTFGAMERTGVQMYTRLQGQVAAVGGTTKDALIPMQSYLHDAAEAADKYGFKLDDATQMLIDQSKEVGIWKDKGKSANDVLLAGIQSLVDKLDELLTTMGLIPKTIDTTIVTHHVDVNAPAPPVEQAAAGYALGGTVYAGSGATIGGPRGTDTVPAWLTPGEDVTSVQQKKDNAEAYAAMQQELMGLRADMRNQFPRSIGRAIGTALVGVRTAS